MWLIKLTGATLFFSLCFSNINYAGDKGPAFEISTTKYLLGTEVEITVVHADIQKAKVASYHAYKEIERIEALLSSHDEQSEISYINHNGWKAPVKVSYETFAILQRAIAYSEKFFGLFDVTIGPLSELWGFNGDQEIKLPLKDELQSRQALVDFHLISFDVQDTTVFLAKKGMRIDLGGIAKGYAVDRAAVVLKNDGVKKFLINAGGDIYACGWKNAKSKWQVGLQHPRKRQKLLARFELSDFAVATSGDYERFVEIDGRRYHHILNPETGVPGDLSQSVTVFAPTVEEADVWATFLFLYGKNDKSPLPNPHKIKSLLVHSDGQIDCDDSLKSEFGLQFLN